MGGAPRAHIDEEEDVGDKVDDRVRDRPLDSKADPIGQYQSHVDDEAYRDAVPIQAERGPRGDEQPGTDIGQDGARLGQAAGVRRIQ